MLNTITALLLSMSSAAFAANPKTIIVTDIDDTIRASHINDFANSSKFAFYEDDVFTGMPELLQMMNQYFAAAPFAYVTNGLEWLTGKANKKFIEKNNFPLGEVFYKKGDDHKFKTINKIIADHAPGRLFLFGDNGERDIETYDAIAKAHPEVDIIQFIHILYKVDGSKILALLPNQIGYVTPIEVMLQLSSLQLIDDTQLSDFIGQVVPIILAEVSPLDSKKPQAIPDWSVCSDLTWLSTWPTSGVSVLGDYYKRIESRCFGIPAK